MMKVIIIIINIIIIKQKPLFIGHFTICEELYETHHMYALVLTTSQRDSYSELHLTGEKTKAH